MNQERLARIYNIVSETLRIYETKDEAIRSLKVTILATRNPDTSIDVQIFKQAIEYLKQIEEK